MGGLTAVCHFFGRNQPWSLFVSPRIQEPLAAQLDATLQRKKGNEPYLMRRGYRWLPWVVAKRFGWEAIWWIGWMSWYWQISPIVFFGKWSAVLCCIVAALRILRSTSKKIKQRRNCCQQSCLNDDVKHVCFFFHQTYLWFFMEVGG